MKRVEQIFSAQKPAFFAQEFLKLTIPDMLILTGLEWINNFYKIGIVTGNVCVKKPFQSLEQQ